jgi:hypothetical protein
MPLLRLMPDGRMLSGPVGPAVDASLPGYDSRVETVVKREGQAISEKMAAQSLASLMKQQTAVTQMAAQAKVVGEAERVRQRNVMLIGQLQSLLGGLKLALGLDRKQAVSSDEDDECDYTG